MLEANAVTTDNGPEVRLLSVPWRLSEIKPPQAR